MLERRTTGICERSSRRVRSTSTSWITCSLPNSVRSSGRSIPVAESRSNQKMTCANAVCRHRTGGLLQCL